MILEKINIPKDLKKIPQKDLDKLAQELRDFILNTVSKNGGHLASSLGVVELTIALHYIYNVPKDKIIWDVGHQTYPHKILTGRKNRFSSIRKYGGLSGFPKTDESRYDQFDVGHSSTSISAALGMVAARDYKRKHNHVIAVIGDGSLTAGIALEGLNNAGYLGKDILIILNDNRMSISNNVGALAEHAKRIKNTNSYQKVRTDYKKIKESIPPKCLPYLDDLKKHLMTLLTPEALFTKLGFDYTGPIDGHNIDKLVKTLKELNKKKGPKLLHIITKKGKGYGHAENDATKFHGISPFDLKSGKKNTTTSKKIVTYTESFADVMIHLGKKNKNLVAITAAMAPGTGLDKFKKKFPKRFFDVGIAEQHAVTFAAGLATQGLIPVVAIYSTFLQRAYDQVIHDVALQNLPVIFAIDRGGLVGADGPTHHGSYDISFLNNVPNLIIAAPKDEDELQDMMYSAIEYGRPVAIRYPRGEGSGISIKENKKYIKPGTSELLRKGNDLALVGIGSTVDLVEKAAEKLAKKGIECCVINARFSKPLDKKMLNHLKMIKKAVIVEENSLIGGFGSHVKQNLHGVKLKLIGLPDKFIEHGSTEQLKYKYGLSVDNIVTQAKKL